MVDLEEHAWPKRGWWVVVRWLVTALAAVVVVLASIWVLQRRFIYFPTQPVPEVSLALPGGEEVTYKTADGLDLNAWFLSAPGGDKQGAVVVFNGNAGNRSHRVPLAEALSERGYSMLLVDYRGYGGNPGSPSEAGLAADARAAAAYLSTRPEVDPARVVYFGESLGAAVALSLAVEQPPAALVLRSPFISLADIGSVHYPLLPISLLLRDRYPNLERIELVGVPVMVIAGSADRIVPAEQSRRLFDAASEPKRLLVIEGADHNDLELNSGEQLIEEVAAFLGDVLP